MSQAESSTNVAEEAAASQPPASRVAAVAKLPGADTVAVVAKPLASKLDAIAELPAADTVTAVAKLPADPAVVVSSGPSVHPAIWGICLLVFAALFFGGVYIGQDFLVDRPHNAGLYIDPKYLDFGEVWAEEAFKWRIPIQNRSDREVGIAEFSASCQCDLIEPPSLTIPPHSTAKVVATIDLTKGRDIEPYEQVRKFQIAIHPIVAVPTSRPPGFVLRGKAKDPFIASPGVVDLGEILSHTAGEPTTIRLKAATPLENLTASPQPDMTIDIKPAEPNREGAAIVAREGAAIVAREGEAIVAREGEAPAEPSVSKSPPLPLSLSAPLDYLLTVTPSDPSDQIPLGKIDRTIHLAAVGADGNQLPPFPIKVTGEIVFDVAIEPRVVYAGLIEMGTSHEVNVSLRSRTSSRFSLIPVDQAPGITLTPLPSARGQETSVEGTHRLSAAAEPFLAENGLVEVSFAVRIRPQIPGQARSVVRFPAVNLASGEQAELELPIVYYALPEKLSDRRNVNVPSR
jgi:hypothetical protein